MPNFFNDNIDCTLVSEYVIDLCTDGVVITDKDARILDVNPAMCQITGYDKDQIIGNKPSLFKSGFHEASFYRDMWKQLRRSGVWQGQIWDRKKSGEVAPGFLRIKAMKSEDGDTVYVGLYQDNSRLEQLSEQANRDPLTNIYNRRMFEARLDLAVSQNKRTGRSFALLFIDLDNFKTINDTQGHITGDKILQSVALRLKQSIREVDTVARLGGDEFAVILQDIDSVFDVVQVAEKLRKKLEVNYIVDDATYTLGASIGYSIYPDETTNLDELVRSADESMYKCKKLSKSIRQIMN